MMSGVSILILTKNEEKDLPGCLESVSWCDDIHLYDSMSTDTTLQIAEKFGVKITQRDYGKSSLPFGGDEAEHRNWGLRNINFKYSWVFVLDADERVSSQLADSIQKISSVKGEDIAFSVCRRDFFRGTWLKHVQVSKFYVRLFRPEKVYYERLINPTLVVDGLVGKLSGYIDHYPFSKGIDHWLNRHNDYSKFEAQQIIANKSKNLRFNLLKALNAKNYHERRFHQKELFYRMPMRPLLKFLLLYFFKKGFLDGRAGLIYSILQSIYEYFIVLKVEEFESDMR